MSGRLRLGLYLGGHIFGQNVRAFVDLARVAEDVGFDDVALGEHLVLSDNAMPPWGRFVHRADEPFPEPLTTLAMIAGATSRIRLVTSILIAPLRPPVLLAKQAATLHELSGGRLVLGVSTSWYDGEYAAVGIPFEERGQRLDDAVGACRALWGAQPATYTSSTVSFENLWCVPTPSSADAIPIWFTGKMRRQLVRRVAAYGHGWLPFLGGPETPLEPLAADVARLREAMLDAGREPSTLEVSARFRTFNRDLDQAFAEDVPKMMAAGITQTYVPVLSLVSDLDEAPNALERVARIAHRYR